MNDSSTCVILNGFPKGGTNLVATVLDLLGLKQGRGAIASSLLFGKYAWLRRLLSGRVRPRDSLIVGVDFPVVVSKKKVRRMVAGIHPGTYLAAHCGYTDHLHYVFTNDGARVVQIIRDPRDIVVSHAAYCATHPEHPLFPYYTCLNLEQRLMFSIRGGITPQGYFLESIGQRARSVDGWVNSPDVLTIRFEDLVGSKGGGNDVLQARCVTDIARFLGIDVTVERVNEICNVIWGTKGRTFRKGQIGTWREVLTPEMLSAYYATARDITRKWGYDVPA